ncbi:ABC transporter ATP-binding protein [Alicyclobacillus macrosporangiidus]|uniref:ABC transporter ATP-binding protein n=1 Tax=Alicyclobacillus macrosporangiidus TaxID=392015 RepID=UPI00068EA135|nr:ABC transporter ATP-binding protein [Alicyclobacillus macrosporangiidus]
MLGQADRTGEWGIQVSHVDRRFGKKLVLQDVSLEVEPAEVFGLLGPSGSGKTTLVKLIAGIDKATRGTVVVGGVKMPRLDMLGKIGYMAQSDALYTELTAKENLDFFASLFGLPNKQRKRRIEEVMELVNLTDSMKKLVSAYSGGMKRRLSLAIALLHRPHVLILDEPTVGIDPALRASIWNELRAMSKAGTTILVTTHVMDEAEKCDRLGMLRDGRLLAVGTPDELKAHTHSTTIEEAFLAFGGGRR